MSKARVNARIELIHATLDQQPILANLLELYAHDFSEFYDLTLGPDGRFGYLPFPLYWSDPDRHPFLFTVDGAFAGFVFVKREPQDIDNDQVWDVAEFFVMRGYRRRGIGTHVAHKVWRRFPGRWQVRVLHSNLAAQEFWRRAISSFVGRAVDPTLLEKDRERWNLFSFQSNPIE
jgi:predicted acetyltransferase